jgi:GTP-binding protein
VAEADLVICVLDASQAPTAADRDTIAAIRQSSKPVLFVANKVDSPRREQDSVELYELGVAQLLSVSAAHGLGIACLETAVVNALGRAESPPDPKTQDGGISVALIGRPNAGKSSLFNRLVGVERSLVAEGPGTTRDPVDSQARLEGHDFLFVDTAGVRRRTKVTPGVEAASVLRAIRAIGRAEVVVVQCDVTAGITEQDARLVGLCCDRGRAVVIALKKVDLLSSSDRRRAFEAARSKLHFAPWITVVQVSARTGSGVRALLRAVIEARGSYYRRVQTAQLNRFFAEVLEHRTPPTSGGKAPRIYYITQAETGPPRFVAMCSSPAAIGQNYRRFVVNRLRSAFGFESVPIIVHYRQRPRRAR